MYTFPLQVRDLVIGYGDKTVLKDISFDVKKGEIFGILGNSGCGKSTLLKHLSGVFAPRSGSITMLGMDVTDDRCRNELMKKIGVTYQGGALFGSMTVAENIALPLELHTDKNRSEIEHIIREKLALVDLAGFEDFFPGELSGGMKKRAGLARALALDPELLFFDEPSAGLDPLAAADLDRLILDMREKLGVTVVVVTHELDSIFTITDRVVIIDKKQQTIVSEGNPADLLKNDPDPFVQDFLNRKGLKRSL